MERSELIACGECDALHWKTSLKQQGCARCARCCAILYRHFSPNQALGVVLISAVLFLIANSAPIAVLDIHGLSNQTTLMGGVLRLWKEGMRLVAVFVFGAALAAPFTELAAFIYLLAPLATGHQPPGARYVLRVLQRVQPWAMIEVLIVGVLVTFIKLSSLGQMIAGPALFALAGLAFLLAVLGIDSRNLWSLLDQSEWRRIPARGHATPDGFSRRCTRGRGRGRGMPPRTDRQRALGVIRAKQVGLIVCNTCGKIHRSGSYFNTSSRLEHSPLSQHFRLRCSRCGAGLYFRKPNSILYTWALLSTAAVLMLPANLLPVIRTQSLLSATRDTLISGIVYFWQSGDWALALIVCIASIVIPLLKLLALGLLATFAAPKHPKALLESGSTLSRSRSRTCDLSADSLRVASGDKRSSPSSLRVLHYAKLCRLIKGIGHWSMLDVFIIMFTVALVHFNAFATVTAGPGALAFSWVVVLTMLASMQFDARLIWDNARF